MKAIKAIALFTMIISVALPVFELLSIYNESNEGKHFFLFAMATILYCITKAFEK
jgi:hypothetical protein